MIPTHYKQVAVTYHRRISHARPHKLKNCLPWQAEYSVELHHCRPKGWTIHDCVGDLKPDNKPRVLGLIFLTEEDAQEWCDYINDMRDEWAAKERKLDRNMPTFTPTIRPYPCLRGMHYGS